MCCLYYLFVTTNCFRKRKNRHDQPQVLVVFYSGKPMKHTGWLFAASSCNGWTTLTWNWLPVPVNTSRFYNCKRRKTINLIWGVAGNVETDRICEYPSSCIFFQHIFSTHFSEVLFDVGVWHILSSQSYLWEKKKNESSHTLIPSTHKHTHLLLQFLDNTGNTADGILHLRLRMYLNNIGLKCTRAHR